MKDLVLDRLCADPSLDLAIDRRGGRSLRCPSCGCVTVPYWHAWQHAFTFQVGPNLMRTVVTCASHYCRSRAKEFA